MTLGLAMAAAVTACGPGDKPSGFGRGTERDFDIFIGATAAGGGTLVMDYDFTREVEVPLSVSLGGSDLFSEPDPGFNPITADESALFVVTEGTPLTLVVTAAEDGASVKVNGVTLAAPGDAAVLGDAVDGAHVHPEWQVVLPTGVLEPRTISFKLTAPGYADSAAATLTLVPTLEAHEDDDHDHDHDDDAGHDE